MATHGGREGTPSDRIVGGARTSPPMHSKSAHYLCFQQLMGCLEAATLPLSCVMMKCWSVLRWHGRFGPRCASKGPEVPIGQNPCWRLSSARLAPKFWISRFSTADFYSSQLTSPRVMRGVLSGAQEEPVRAEIFLVPPKSGQKTQCEDIMNIMKIL